MYKTIVLSVLSIIFIMLLSFSAYSAQPSICYDGTPATIIDHLGEDWNIILNSEIVGKHININTFKIAPGVDVKVKAFDGINCGTLDISAQNIIIDGTLDATGKGYGGGGGGGGLPGTSGEYGGSNCGSFGIGGSGVAGGLNGTNAFYVDSANAKSGLGGTGGGVCGGNGGAFISKIKNQNLLTDGWCETYSDSDVIIPGIGGEIGNYSCAVKPDNNLTEVWMGSGGGGGSGGSGASTEYNCNANAGGGGGGAGAGGGGAISLVASNSLVVSSTGNIYSKGENGGGNGFSGGNVYAGCDHKSNGGNGGNASTVGAGVGGASGTACSGSFSANNACGTSTNWCFLGAVGGSGGVGAGGGILLKANNVNVSGAINDLGGNNNFLNGGTVKIFSCGSPIINELILTGRLFTQDTCPVLPMEELCDGINNDGDLYIDEGCYSCQSGDFFEVSGRYYCFDYRGTSGVTPPREVAEAHCGEVGATWASYLDGESDLDINEINNTYKLIAEQSGGVYSISRHPVGGNDCDWIGGECYMGLQVSDLYMDFNYVFPHGGVENPTEYTYLYQGMIASTSPFQGWALDNIRHVNDLAPAVRGSSLPPISEGWLGKIDMSTMDDFTKHGIVCERSLPYVRDFNCSGVLPDNSQLITPDENIGLISPLDILLVNSGGNTIRKCEAVCDKPYLKQDQNCVLQTDLNGECGNRDTNFLSTVSDWPLGSEYCSSGKASPDPDFPLEGQTISWECMGLGTGTNSSCSAYKEILPVFGDCIGGDLPPDPVTQGVVKGAESYESGYSPTQWTYRGDANMQTPCLWKCDAGYTREGVGCILAGSVGSDINNIEFIDLSFEDQNIIAKIQCSNNLTNATLSIVDGQNNDITASVIFISSDGLTVSNGNLECNMVSTKYVLKSDGYEGDQKYLVTATIPQSCNVCSRSGFVFYGDDSPIAVPDANLVVVVLVVCLALFMILRKRI